jgi:hypothetical protein
MTSGLVCPFGQGICLASITLINPFSTSIINELLSETSKEQQVPTHTPVATARVITSGYKTLEPPRESCCTVVLALKMSVFKIGEVVMQPIRYGL